MVSTKRRRGEGTDTKPALVIALRQENEELREKVEKVKELREERDRSREEVKRLKLRIAKYEAMCKKIVREINISKAALQIPQEKEKEVKLSTEVWAIIAGKLNKNDVCSFALVSKQLREAQVLAGRKLVTKPCWKGGNTFFVTYFTEDWCAYWSRKFNVYHTDPELIKRVLYVAAYNGYLEVFKKYWSKGPQEKLSKVLNEQTCSWAALDGHLEVMKWLRAKGCPWGIQTSCWAAQGGRLEVLQWMRAQDPPCPWTSSVCSSAARQGHLDVLRWARSQGCPWDERAPCAAAKNGHLKVLNWLEFITTNGLNGHDKTKRAYTNTRVRNSATS
ncbi:hypothetical protein HKI87_12g69600 [Chloropicon roscoffensis]|uniref:F-box domain-containing protein n=1 Tax=Chloropicon roscoffensis TaxID=1461544 RepID=A0AAX4PHJ1_9CHLO